MQIVDSIVKSTITFPAPIVTTAATILGVAASQLGRLEAKCASSVSRWTTSSQNHKLDFLRVFGISLYFHLLLLSSDRMLVNKNKTKQKKKQQRNTHAHM